MSKRHISSYTLNRPDAASRDLAAFNPASGSSGFAVAGKWSFTINYLQFVCFILEWNMGFYHSLGFFGQDKLWPIHWSPNMDNFGKKSGVDVDVPVYNM